MTTQRTYWHLEGRGRVPTRYEIATTRLSYHAERGFALPTPIAGWHERYQKGSRLAATFASFADPRATTYSSYVAQQHERESFVDQLCRSIDETEYDHGLDAGWLRVLEAVLPVLRFPCHGLQMLACYVGHMAPEGRVTAASAFQAMDELRRVQRIAYRMRQLYAVRPGFGEDARRAWQEEAAWQPLRWLIERLLCTYDFGESSVATLLVVKPAFDALFMGGFARLAAERGDRLWLELSSSLDQDCRWHAAWAEAFVSSALGERAENRAPIVEWLGAWWPETREALAAAIGPWQLPLASGTALLDDVESSVRARWARAGAYPDV